MSKLKTALVHDWLVSPGGGEKVLEAIYNLYPGPLHVLVKNNDYTQHSFWQDKDIHTSFLQHLPFASQAYRYFLPLFPRAIEQFDLSGYDLILSSSHAVAKNVLTHANQLHISYCNTPMRYAWDLYHPYLRDLKGIKRWMARNTLYSLRTWDSISSRRADYLIANSKYIAKRIEKVYGREAAVIYPGVPVHLFVLGEKREDFYLTVSRMVPYKRIDLIVQAFATMPDKKLVVVGDGPEMPKIKRLATPNIELLGDAPDQEVRRLMSKARAFIFAAEEDFGIVPVEAQASGTPVIAFGRGGALETVKDGVTGLFFEEQTVHSLCEAVFAFEKCQDQFDPLVIRNHAEQFSEDRFRAEFSNFVETKKCEFYESHHSRRR